MKKKEFVNKLKNRVENINIANVYNCEILETIMEKIISIVKELWYKYTKQVNITKYSKAWQNNEYSRNLLVYQISRKRIDWIKYRNIIKLPKQIFFDNKI